MTTEKVQQAAGPHGDRVPCHSGVGISYKQIAKQTLDCVVPLGWSRPRSESADAEVREGRARVPTGIEMVGGTRQARAYKSILRSAHTHT